MSLLLALFLVVHGGVHVGFLCSRSWPFAATDSWLAGGLGIAPATADAIGAVAALTTFIAFLLAAAPAIGLPPRGLWAPLVIVGSVASAVLLVLFATPATLPGLAIDALLLWAVLGRGWRPTPLVGRQTRARRPVTS